MKIALASPRVATSLADGLAKIEYFLKSASSQGATLVCFPEAYLPGLRGQDFQVLPFGQEAEALVQQQVSHWAKAYQIAVILGMEKLTAAGRQIIALVIDESGHIQGYQSKTQLAPSEDAFYVPGNRRHLFSIKGLRFGISICHEGWRYPESVRWAARQGAQLVFHPHHTGSDQKGLQLSHWGSTEAPYYEKAMCMRSLENAIYFASVNYAMRFQESATCLIRPDGHCQAFLPYGQEGLLLQSLDLDAATGLYARRYAPERYPDFSI